MSSRRPDLGSGRKSAIVKDEGILFKAEEELVGKGRWLFGEGRWGADAGSSQEKLPALVESVGLGSRLHPGAWAKLHTGAFARTFQA